MSRSFRALQKENINSRNTVETQDYGQDEDNVNFVEYNHYLWGLLHNHVLLDIYRHIYNRRTWYDTTEQVIWLQITVCYLINYDCEYYTFSQTRKKWLVWSLVGWQPTWKHESQDYRRSNCINRKSRKTLSPLGSAVQLISRDFTKQWHYQFKTEGLMIYSIIFFVCSIQNNLALIFDGQNLWISLCHSMGVKKNIPLFSHHWPADGVSQRESLTFVSLFACLALAGVTDCSANRPAHTSPD